VKITKINDMDYSDLLPPLSLFSEMINSLREAAMRAAKAL
jgi:hypothetical protein